MKVFRGSPCTKSDRPCALAIGNFDGVHRGHQAMLSQVYAIASREGIDAAVMTFEPHPREFFAEHLNHPHKAPHRIASLRDKLQSIKENNIDRVIVKRFNTHFANITPDNFVKMLAQELHVKYLIVGEDFCYGAKRAGNLASLINASEHYHFHVQVLPTVLSNGVRISSSTLRQALLAGDFLQAKQLTGRAYTISGHVAYGQQLGRTLGFPTLNIHIGLKRPVLNGIFVVQVHGLTDKPIAGVASIGTRPSVNQNNQIILEVHLFDFSENCYGKLIQVEFLQKLREEEKYDTLTELTTAIENDAKQARAYFQSRPVDQTHTNNLSAT